MADTYYNRTSLLLHCNGANNSTVFTDNSIIPNTVTRVGVPVISTASYKFGGSSAYFPGGSSASALLIPSSVFNFGRKDFTIEFWISALTPNPLASYTFVMASSYWDTPNTGFYMNIDGPNTGWGGLGNIYFTSAEGCNYRVSLQSTTVFPNTGWHHVAISRNGYTHRIFVDGILESTSTLAGITNYGVTYGYIAGMRNLANTGSDKSQKCYMDEIRITNGIGRYTENFTPETSQFVETQDLTCTGFLCNPEIKTCNPASISGPSQGFLCNPSLKTYNSEDGGNYYVDGYITLDTNSISIKVYLFSLNNGRVIQEVKSNPLTGYYRFNNLKYQDYYIWCEKNLKPISRLIINNQLLRH